MSRCQADMERVSCGLRRDWAGAHQSLSQALGILAEDEDWYASNGSPTTCNDFRIASRYLLDDEFRYEQPKSRTALPPLSGDSLVRSNDQILADAGSRVADDRRLDVYAGLHRDKLLGGSGGRKAATFNHRLGFRVKP
jgi:hypothetical protein